MPVVRVVPNIPSFAVDDGFWYALPAHLVSDADVGRIVRVPLGGRRVRGWVVERSHRPGEGLKELAGVSGDLPVFDADLFKSLVWAAHHFVAPVSVLLARATPPNLPGPVREVDGTGQGVPSSLHPLLDVARQVAGGTRRPTLALLGRWQLLDWLEALAPVMGSGRSAVVIAATAAEVERIATHARKIFTEAVVGVASETDAEVTRDWESAQQSGRLVVGTPRIATWGIAGLAMAVILEEGRRAMKDRQTPTLHVREIMRTRALIEGFTNVFFGPTPSLEILAAGADMTMIGNRAWPLVEVVDRSEEAPGSGLLASRVVAALRAITDAGKRSFVLTTHRLTDSTVGEIKAKLGSPVAGLAPTAAPVAVGTERDLATLDPVSLAVAANPDGMLMIPGYRSEEETLRQLARLANMLDPGRGHRMMLQTFEPDRDLAQTLRRGNPIPLLERILVDRARAGLPPSTEMIALELREVVPENIDSELRGLPGANVLGPVDIETGQRWLLEGDLGITRLALRELVGRWRNQGATVRVDVDPIDL